jgi:hypothetical protein
LLRPKNRACRNTRQPLRQNPAREWLRG